MGRRKSKKKSLTDLESLSDSVPEDRTAPVIIPKVVFDGISKYMLRNSVASRNVFLTVCEYPFCDVNPNYVPEEGGPTHIVFFCLRIIRCNHFSPICLIQINKEADKQADKLAVVWKAIIQDLSILELFVIGSLSPCLPLFYSILEILTKNPNLANHSGCITYSAYPYREIVHLYDNTGLMFAFQQKLIERKEILYVACAGLDYKPFEIYCANWKDIEAVMTLIDSKYTSKSEDRKQYSIFSPRFVEICDTYFLNDFIETKTKDSTCHFMNMISDITDFWQCPDFSPSDIQSFYNTTENFRMLLCTAHFAQENEESSNRYNGDFNEYFDIDLEKLLPADKITPEMSAYARAPAGKSLLDCLQFDKYSDSKIEEFKIDHFSEFVEKLCYDKNKMLTKTCDIMNCKSVGFPEPSLKTKQKNYVDTKINRKCFQSKKSSDVLDSDKEFQLFAQELKQNNKNSRSKDHNSADTKKPVTNSQSTESSNVNKSQRNGHPKKPYSAENTPTQETEIPEEIDYETYRKKLVKLLEKLSVCDKKKCNCDNIFTHKISFDTLYSMIPADTDKLRVTNDWLCTLKGYLFLADRLEEHHIRSVKSNLFCLNHIDFYMSMIRRFKNNATSLYYDREHYTFLDRDSAFELLEPGKGVYIVTPE